MNQNDVYVIVRLANGTEQTNTVYATIYRTYKTALAELELTSARFITETYYIIKRQLEN